MPARSPCGVDGGKPLFPFPGTDERDTLFAPCGTDEGRAPAGGETGKSAEIRSAEEAGKEDFEGESPLSETRAEEAGAFGTKKSLPLL